MILNTITTIFTVALIIFYKFFTTTGLGVSILIIFLILFCILLYFWWRCPHCDTFFGNFRGFQNIVRIAVTNWNNLGFYPVLFQLYSPLASYIELRSVIFASQVIFASRVLKANIISLKPQVSISLSRSENITLCEAQNITNILRLIRFYAILHTGGDDMKAFENLPNGYNEIYAIDLQKNKKQHYL